MSEYAIECPFAGSQKPHRTGHLVLEFSIPEKCLGCVNYHEGRCRIITNRLVRLHYGFCGIERSKELVSDPRAKRAVPKKCTTCSYFAERELYGVVCTKDSDIWGDVPRGLDY